MEDLVRAVRNGIISLQEFRDRVVWFLHPDQIADTPWVSEPEGIRDEVIVSGIATQDLRAGDLVTVNPDGGWDVRGRDAPIGVALGDGVIRVGGVVAPSIEPLLGRRAQAVIIDEVQDNVYASIMHGSSQVWWSGSVAMNTQLPSGRRGGPQEQRYQYSENRFSPEAVEKAWKLLEKYMSPEQYFAFMEYTTVELINKAETHRLLINKKGDFTILQGLKAGAGITESAGTIHSYKYPLGDEISAFLDWFKHRTGELISNWNCGNYGIVKEGERR